MASGHHPGVRPIGDVDIVMGQESLDRAAQQRRVMAGHRRDDEELRLRCSSGQVALEAQDAAERPLPDHLLRDRDHPAVHRRVVEAEARLGVTAGHPLEHLGRGGHGPAESRGGDEGGLRPEAGEVGRGAGRTSDQVSEFMKLVGQGIHDVLRSPRWRRGRSTAPAAFTLRYAINMVCSMVTTRWGARGKVSCPTVFPGRVLSRSAAHSPICSSDPLRRALASRSRKAIEAAVKRTTFKASASAIRSILKTWSTSTWRMPSKT